MSAAVTGWHELVTRLTEGDLRVVAHELANEVQTMAVLVARLRRTTPGDPAVRPDLGPVERALGRSVSLTRRLRELLFARPRSGELASLTRAVRELAVTLGQAMPEGTAYNRATASPSRRLNAAAYCSKNSRISAVMT